MGVLRRYLSWYWSNGRKVASVIHRLSGAIAGLLFVVALPLGASTMEVWVGRDVPLVPPADRSIALAFISVAMLFAFFVFLETLAGITAWVFRILSRVFG